MLGIDVSKRSLACSCLDGHSQAPLWECTVPNTRAGIERMLARTPATMSWVVEPSCPYSRGVVETAHRAGRQVLQAQPKAARAFLTSVSPRAKSDRLDGHGLARYALAVALRPYPQKSAGVE